ncbi:hypothetical protein CYY_003641 [Polysphondylium violaceum]|uniref:AB hydrolase-1 domain-containing protein n=1 Tax=Polysphondylium violaceum TaxID=133409 RepID=A0A8J4V8I0_9MYCE|nr:hypothetical protein CYY_003641 [Polysphondylium violaceum]
MIKKNIKSIQLDQKGSHNVSFSEWSSEASQQETILPRQYIYCVHRLTGNSSDFDFLAESLIKDNENRVVICIDIPGRGKSDFLKDPSNYHVEFYAWDMVQFIEKISYDKDIDFIGTSMGGLIGMVLYQLPKKFKIRNLILNDIGPQVSTQSMNNIANYVQKVNVFDTREESEIYLQNTHKGFGELTSLQWKFLFDNCIIEKNSKFIFHYDPMISIRFTQVEQDLNLWEIYNKIDCKIFILRGKESEILSKQVYNSMLELSNNKGIEFDNVGHAPMLFSSEQIEPIIQFINQV